MSVLRTVSIAAALIVAFNAIAQTDYPTKPIRLIVPFAPGGGTDIVARVMAQKAGEILKQSVVVDNRGGAGGVIGMEMSVRAAPDGYTLGIVSGSIATTAAANKLAFDPVKDIAPISMLGEAGFLLTLNPAVPAKTTQELIAYAKAYPGKVTYGSSGTGGTSHLVGELFDLMAGTQMTHVPYKSSGPALTDMLGGQIQMIYGSSPLVTPQMNSGRLRVIAITTLKRSRALPNIPTVTESGVPGFETITWYALSGPRGLPPAVVTRWQQALITAQQSREMKERFELDGLDAPEIGAAYFNQVLQRDLAKWSRVVKAKNLKL
ncbi:MAG: transporter substrate-binding protein [Betaproteobacteria bacterium]|nr:transporter substrate-binding protein [Betaproteobacteria bacterium]